MSTLIKPVVLQLNGSMTTSEPFLISCDAPIKVHVALPSTIAQVSPDSPGKSPVTLGPAPCVQVKVQVPEVGNPESGSSGVAGAVSPGSSSGSGSERGGSSSLA